MKIPRISRATTGNEIEDIADIVRVGKQDVGTNTEAADNQQVKGKGKKKKNNPNTNRVSLYQNDTDSVTEKRKKKIWRRNLRL